MKWDEILEEEINKTYYKSLMKEIDKLYNEKTIYPKKEEIFKSFDLCPFNNLKVVIIGQDPYHGEGEAMGLSFSVRDSVKCPPSLRNIKKELALEGYNKENNDLTSWAKEGVFLLNSILTVEQDKALSHKYLNWERFTDEVIKLISKHKENVVFILLGKYAESKKDLIDNNKHLILITSHPSPFSASRGFLGSNVFKDTNKYLIENKKEPINWSL